MPREEFLSFFQTIIPKYEYIKYQSFLKLRKYEKKLNILLLCTYIL